VLVTIRIRFRATRVESVDEQLGLGGGIDAEAAAEAEL
jgi:hypothetical protein